MTEGEIWARDALRRLRGRRSSDVRGARPDLARRSQRWELAATCLMLEWHLGMVESEAGEPRNLSAAGEGG